MTPGSSQVQSRRPSPGYTGTLGMAGHKADAAGTTWVVGKQRFWQSEGLQGHVGEIPQRKSIRKNPKSRPDHISATINNVCSKVGGVKTGPHWRRPTCMPNAEEKLVLCATQRRHCSQNALPIYIIRAASGLYISLR